MSNRRVAFYLVAVGVLAATSVLAFSCSAGTRGPVSGSRAMAHVEKMVSHGPRPSGSAAIKRTQAYLVSEIEKLGLNAHKQEWRDPKSTLRFKNIWTEIPGADPKGKILIIGAHYDTKLCKGHPNAQHNFPFLGAIDGAGASAVLLELARVLEERKNRPNIWLLWIDGEESIPWDWGKGEQALHGSKHFVKTMSADKERFPKGFSYRVKAFVLMDLIGSKNLKIDQDYASHSTLSDIFKDAATSLGEQDRMYANKSTMTDDHIPFKELGVWVIDLIDFHFRVPGHDKDPRYEQWWHTAKDDIPAMDAASLQFIGNLVWTALPILEERIFKKK